MTTSSASPSPRVPAVARRGLMLIVSSPSGAGKTTIARALLARDSDIAMSVSVTTRGPRPSEVDGQDYRFVDEAQFRDLVARGELLEHARVFGHLYGTPRAPVEAALKAGRDVLFDIDWQGTQQLVEHSPGDVVRVFILPPSTAELERRLYSRAQDSETVVRRRMAEAAREMSRYPEYDYVVVNNDVATTVAVVDAILIAERARRQRLVGLHDFVARLQAG